MSTTTAAVSDLKLRLWVLSWGLYPRRVIIYLKEKGILEDFEVIPVNITAQGMESPPGKPEGTMPILEIARPSADGRKPGQYVFQSIAILQYLEEKYAEHGPCMLGATPEERAHSRDLLAVLDEAVAFAGRYVHNASAIFSTMEPQSADGARVCLDRAQQLFSQVEDMASANGPYLVRGYEQRPMILDCVAMATLQFFRVVYGVDFADDKHPKLAKLYAAFSGQESAAWDELPPEPLAQMAKSLSVQ